MERNTLYYGDCLEWMQEWIKTSRGSVDLVYLDPPFNSKTHYNILYSSDENGTPAQLRAFSDTWRWNETAARRVERITRAVADPCHKVISKLYELLGTCGMVAYLSYMAERLAVMHVLLKETGSLYLHCDPTASHYLKIIMDSLFGAQNFRNEIVWRIGWVSGYKTQKRGWIRNHDTILYYVKSAAAAERFNKEYLPYSEDYERRNGKNSQSKYVDEEIGKGVGKGIPIEDTWNCQPADKLNSIMITSFSKEKLGYDTQKPLALLKRIIKASSAEGELVLDPFCGCGTTIEAAQSLQRQWIGIDISAFAIDLIRKRRLKDATIPAQGIPADLKSARKLAKEKPFDFETWAVSRLPGIAPNEVQVGDGGIDGRGQYIDHKGEKQLVLVQAKGGKFQISHFREFLHVAEREHAALAVFITLDPVSSPSAIAEAANKGEKTLGANSYPRMQLWTIAQYFEGIKPNLPAMLDPFTGKAMHPDMFVD